MCAFQDHRFSDEIDKLTGYKTQSILCLAICNSDGEVIGVVQAINKNPMGTPFTEDDEKVRSAGEHKHSSEPWALRTVFVIAAAWPLRTFHKCGSRTYCLLHMKTGDPFTVCTLNLFNGCGEWSLRSKMEGKWREVKPLVTRGTSRLAVQYICMDARETAYGFELLSRRSQ